MQPNNQPDQTPAPVPASQVVLTAEQYADLQRRATASSQTMVNTGQPAVGPGLGKTAITVQSILGICVVVFVVWSFMFGASDWAGGSSLIILVLAAALFYIRDTRRAKISGSQVKPNLAASIFKGFVTLFMVGLAAIGMFFIFIIFMLSQASQSGSRGS